jgi:hypothetical protein
MTHYRNKKKGKKKQLPTNMVPFDSIYFLRFHYASQRPSLPISSPYSHIGTGLREASRGASRSSLPIVVVIVSSPSSDARPSLPLPPHASAAAVALPGAPTTPATSRNAAHVSTGCTRDTSQTVITYVLELGVRLRMGVIRRSVGVGARRHAILKVCRVRLRDDI